MPMASAIWSSGRPRAIEFLDPQRQIARAVQRGVDIVEEGEAVVDLELEQASAVAQHLGRDDPTRAFDQ